MLGALVPHAAGQLGQRGRERVHRILRQLRVGDVALHAVHRQPAAEGAAAADLDGVAEDALRSRARRRRTSRCARRVRASISHDALRAVHRRAFLVAGDQEGDRALDAPGAPRRTPRWRSPSPPVRSSCRRRRARRACRRGSWARRGPCVHSSSGPGRHHVGVPGEAEHRAAGAVGRPEVLDVAVAQRLDLKPSAARRAVITAWQPSSAGVTEARPSDPESAQGFGTFSVGFAGSVRAV